MFNLSTTKVERLQDQAYQDACRELRCSYQVAKRLDGWIQRLQLYWFTDPSLATRGAPTLTLQSTAEAAVCGAADTALAANEVDNAHDLGKRGSLSS